MSPDSLATRELTMKPSPHWGTPATGWTEAIERYISFLMTPSRRGVTERKGVGVRELSQENAVEIRRKLNRQLSRLDRDDWPHRPSDVAQVNADRIVALRKGGHRKCEHGDSLWHLWRTIVFDRFSYTCAYCGRSAWGTLQEPGGLTIRFALDHRNPKYREQDRDDFDLTNIVLACRSCNHIKGAMDFSRFHEELISLGRAIYRKYPDVSEHGGR